MQSLSEIADQVRAGNRRAIARALSIVEGGGDSAETLIDKLSPFSGNAHIVGITGPPGVGKSTLVNSLAKEIRKENLQVAILAIDPSSPISGGAILGDRIRMADLFVDKSVFIRSVANRGQLGGLALAAVGMVTIFDAAGFDMIVVETVGTGQAEVEIVSLAHTTIVVTAPGFGDDVQANKAGIIESADIFVVNKADHPGSDHTVRILTNMLQLGRDVAESNRSSPELNENNDKTSQIWEVPVLTCIAIEENGLAQLLSAIRMHATFLKAGDGWAMAERLRRQNALEQLLLQTVRRGWRTRFSAEERDKLLQSLVDRHRTPTECVNLILAKLGATIEADNLYK